jgi:hypothetical protein
VVEAITHPHPTSATRGGNSWSHSDRGLAGGQEIEEETYEVDFPFDGKVLKAEATFVGEADILVGTHLLREHRLDVNFPAATVLIERVP